MDPAHFEELFSQLYGPLCRVSFRLVRDKDAAEDLVQEVFIKFWQRVEFLDSDTIPKAYLYKSVYNASLNFLSEQKKVIKPEKEYWNSIETSGKADDGLHLENVQAAVESGLEQLPPVCKTVFIMSRNDEMSYKEIADSLDISLKTVEAHMSKALRVLRKHLILFLSTILLIIWTSIKNS